MKNLIYIVLFSLFGSLHAQISDSSIVKKMEDAERYLHGFLKPYDPDKAYLLFKQCAEAGNPKAMNAIGNMYNEGLGIDTSKSEAINWYKKAANSGYPQAWYNLGMMYKYANGVGQDNKRAYDCFKKAADLNYSGGMFLVGYMHYKGLGCKQDYKKAFNYFNKGYEKGRPSCKYFLGLCYRNGYGVARDTIKAYQLLKEAFISSQGRALIELLSNQPENYIKQEHKLKSAKIGETNKNVAYKKVAHKVPNYSLNGEYTGTIVTYDWSGQNTIRQVPLKLILNQNGKQLTGQWIEADSLFTPIEAYLADSSVLFSSTEYRKTDHYSQFRPLLWKFSEAKLEIVKTDTSIVIAGNISMYSPENMEPSKPMYLLLSKVNKEISEKSNENTTTLKDNFETISKLVAFPNPFNNEVNLSFSLKEGGFVNILVYSRDGGKMLVKKEGNYPEGNNTATLNLQLPVGAYIIKVVANNDEAATIVVKQ